MPIFGKTFFALALVAGAVHVFRKDLIRVASMLKKPLESFVKEVSENSKAAAEATKSTTLNAPQTSTTTLSAPAPPAPKQIETINTSSGINTANVVTSSEPQTGSSSTSSQPEQAEKLR
jgi:hypothetical protein